MLAVILCLAITLNVGVAKPPSTGPYYLVGPPPSNNVYLFGRYSDNASYYSIKGSTWEIAHSINVTELWEAALDDATKGSFFFQSGIYELNLVVDEKDVTICGEGHNSTVFVNDNANPIIDVQGSSGSSLKGITIEDVTIQSSGSSGIGIQATHCYHTLTIRGVRVQDMASYGIYLETCYDALIHDCIIQSNTDWGVYLYKCHAAAVTDTYLINNGGLTAGNLYINHTAGASIHGATIENSKYGVKVTSKSNGVTISNSFLEVSNEGSNLVWITGNATHYPRNTVVQNCFFEGHSGSWPDAYIYVDYCTKAKIQNNYMPCYPGMIGINITAYSTYAQVSHNTFLSTGTFITDLGDETTIIQPQDDGFWWSGDNRTDLIVNPTSEASYIVETDGTNTWMTNCSTGQRDATSTDADQLSNWALGNLTGTSPKQRVVWKGSFTIDAPIQYVDYSILDLYQADFTLADNSDCNMLECRNSTDGNIMVEIWGGHLDGNYANNAWGDAIHHNCSGGSKGDKISRWSLIVKDTFIYEPAGNGIFYDSTAGGGGKYNIKLSKVTVIDAFCAVNMTNPYDSFIGEQSFLLSRATGTRDMYLYVPASIHVNDIYLPYQGLELSGGKTSLYQHMLIDNSPTEGIKITGDFKYNTMCNVRVSGCATLANNTYAAVDIGGTSNHNVFSTFAIDIFGKTNQYTYGIDEGAACDYNEFGVMMIDPACYVSGGLNKTGANSEADAGTIIGSIV